MIYKLTNGLEVDIRRYSNERDRNFVAFIVDSMTKHCWDFRMECAWVPKEAGRFFTEHFNKYVKKLLDHNQAVVAVSPENQDHIIGYIAYNGECDMVRQYTYVKQPYRCTELFDALDNVLYDLINLETAKPCGEMH
jgi:hypothetical protein